MPEEDSRLSGIWLRGRLTWLVSGTRPKESVVEGGLETNRLYLAEATRITLVVKASSLSRAHPPG